MIDEWAIWVQRCRIPAFVELGRKINGNLKGVEAAMLNNLSNALVESTNTKLRVLHRWPPPAEGLSKPASRAERRAADKLKPGKQPGTVHFDETGARVNGRLARVHGASNAALTLLDCHARRGRVAMEDLGAIAHMSGIAVHAGWRPYRGFNVSHALCDALRLRELQGVGVVWDQGWANDPAELLIEAKVAVEEAKDARATDLDATTLTGNASEATTLGREAMRSITISAVSAGLATASLRAGSGA